MTPEDVQVWARSLGNMFGGGRQSFLEHVARSRATVASWQVDFKKEGLTWESCGKGKLSYHNRRFNHVELQCPWLEQRQRCIRYRKGPNLRNHHCKKHLAGLDCPSSSVCPTL